MKATLPSAFLVEPGAPPDALPASLESVEAPLSPAQLDVERTTPTTLFLTVDVEDTYFNNPILMTGDGIGRGYGVFGILDELDAHGLQATFFVNVYEKDRQPQGVVKDVVREIASRGHEIGLHSHPSQELAFYRRPLFRLSRLEQTEVLRWGADVIEDWIGERPTSFRAGAYAVNDETFEALAAAGIRLDSSCFFPSPNNHNRRETVNAISVKGDIIEVPVTTVLRSDSAGRLSHRKLDLDWLSVEELSEALSSLVQYGAAFATFMMHSFSFIKKETRMPDEPPSSKARFISEVHQDRYVEVYGPKPAMRDAFSDLCCSLASDPSLRVRRLCDEISTLRNLNSKSRDVIPVVT